jgi:hypothetical protein
MNYVLMCLYCVKILPMSVGNICAVMLNDTEIVASRFTAERI